MKLQTNVVENKETPNNGTVSVEQTVADIIVDKLRARFRKTGKKKSCYDRFDLEDIVETRIGRVSTCPVCKVVKALNDIKGVKAQCNEIQIGPAEWLEVLTIELS